MNQKVAQLVHFTPIRLQPVPGQPHRLLLLDAPGAQLKFTHTMGEVQLRVNYRNRPELPSSTLTLQSRPDYSWSLDQLDRIHLWLEKWISTRTTPDHGQEG